MTTRREFLVKASAGSVVAGLASTSSVAGEGPGRPSRNFVLVHGAFHGGWCYARVAAILRAHGHHVFTPTLTGTGERSHLTNVSVNYSTHIRDVINVIKWERLGDVVLCGHSYGGAVISGVADAIPEQIASLVYLEAVFPENGKSLLDLTPELVSSIVDAASDQGGFLVKPTPFLATLRVNSKDRALVDALCTPQPLATFCERINLKGAYLGVKKKTLVQAINADAPDATDASIPEKIWHDQSWSIRKIVSGHEVMLDAPQELANVLLDVM